MLGWIQELLSKFASFLMDVLPHSPIQRFLVSFDDLPYLSYLNWFIPVSSIIVVLEAWLVAIALFYLYSVIMRWVKLIGD